MDSAERLAEKLLVATITHRETLRHCIATQEIAIQVARAMRFESRTISKIGIAALLHDLGKCEIAESTLDAPRPLSHDELRDMREHPWTGAAIARKAGIDEDVCHWIMLHHERADGNGYGRVAGQNIPSEARVVIVADVWEALRSLRPYARFMPHEERLRTLAELGFKEEIAALRGLFEGALERVS